MRQTRGFIQTYFIYSNDKAFLKKPIFKGYFKKALITAIPEIIYSSTIKIGFLWICYEKYL